MQHRERRKVTVSISSHHKMCQKSKSFSSGNFDLFISDPTITSLPSLSNNVSNGDYFGVFDNVIDDDTSDTTAEGREDFIN